jgi:hypothetical protein
MNYVNTRITMDSSTMLVTPVTRGIGGHLTRL